ncbi:hypothetical protein HID58_081326 [Brassica napus]|uniref:Uncharacterized protein n=1 Tax=Brassica napus TaxID=3708 RepID=A0ABQ7Y7E8_BRANA|nr:hypothetical protein HID58_081326 [Brassica napus]
MANWISSKLKAAETILQQIDQQAAESLRKDEKPETTYDEAFETFSKSASLVSLKDQLRKKTYEGSSSSDGGSQRNSLELKPSGKTLRRSDQARVVVMEGCHKNRWIRKESEKDVNAAAPSPLDNSTRYTTETFIREKLSNVGRKEGREPIRSDVWRKQVRGEVSKSNVSDGLERKDSSFSSDDSESDYESDSSTDSERERQRDERRRRREKVFA